MITGAILQLLAAVIEVIVSPLPTASLSLSASVASWVTDGSGVIGFLNDFLPISEMITALGLVLLVWLPTVIVYQTVNWIYRHIPFAGG